MADVAPTSRLDEGYTLANALPVEFSPTRCHRAGSAGVGFLLTFALLGILGERSCVSGQTEQDRAEAFQGIIAVEPRRVEITGRNPQQHVVVTAEYPDGRFADVTRRCSFSISDPQVARF